MPKKQKITYLPSDSRYDKPFKYLKKHDAYLVTLQSETRELPELSPKRRSEIARRAVLARWCLVKRLKRIAKAKELADELGIDEGVAEGTLLALERSPSERLARGLMRGRWAKVRA